MLLVFFDTFCLTFTSGFSSLFTSSSAKFEKIFFKVFELISQGGTQHIRIRGGQAKKFSGNPKISLQLQRYPKISAHFIYINLYMNIKYPQTMQIEVRIASIEPRNINITMFGIKKYHEHSFSFLWTQIYHFWQHSDPKNIGLTSPYVHVPSAPLGLILSSKQCSPSFCRQI